ncbi:hypothetical protein LXA43DRAFT_991133 [Ganoderma leucocontextum]|nr:hypothetical protein LXA43DRAFT_991133 [Ganoderma leucocontextum]
MEAIDIEMLERIVGDISHTGPAVTGLLAFISKHVDKKKMTVMLQTGEHQLHLASIILEHKHVKKLLGSNHEQLKENYAQLHETRNDYENNLKSLQNKNLWKKFVVSRKVSSWVRDSIAYKHNVIRQSDWAKLGLVLRDGKLIPIKQTLGSPSEQTLVTPASRKTDKAVDKEDDDDESDGELCASLPYVRFDDIPIDEAHEMQDLLSDGSGPSVPPKRVRFSKLLKGKARAQEP